MSNRASRSRRRQLKRVKVVLGASGWALEKLRRRLAREREHPERIKQEQAERQAERATSDPRLAAYEAKRRKQHEEIAALVRQTKAREEEKARRAWTRAREDDRAPITRVEWSPANQKGRDR